jgi:bifunctional UDP-N-acetylglucosamine pyrophosphorylase / glucosamine-1-phosphate N-acetyltransferase
MAAGLGTRMRSAVPKHLHALLGRRVVDWVILAAQAAGVERVVVVTAPETRDLFPGVEVAVQERPLGTGDAVRAARASLDGLSGDVLVLNGDVPALSAGLLRELIATHRRERAVGTVLSFEPPDRRDYGRVVRGADGRLAKIVEAGDATPAELELSEVNSGIYVFRADKLWSALDRLEPQNVQGELYVTDTLGFLVADGDPVAVFVAPDPLEVEGINTRVELAAAAAALRDRINREHMLAGVTLVDPETTWIEPTVELEPDVTIQPFVILRGSTRVATGAEIDAHTVAVDARIESGAFTGPFCYLRPGTILEAQSKAGTFVEIKNSRIGPRAKVPHQSYIGDADIGEGTNIGAGAITANYPHRPGEPKRRTTIGRNVRTGVHNAFVAPVELGDGAWIAAGSVITKDVPAEALAVARARQENKEGYAARHRDE